jgi:hypothetical protein
VEALLRTATQYAKKRAGKVAMPTTQSSVFDRWVIVVSIDTESSLAGTAMSNAVTDGTSSLGCEGYDNPRMERWACSVGRSSRQTMEQQAESEKCGRYGED